ncbi:MAG TPA: iron ABC transporter permease [Stellaceae bacterium]|nr:iron ABC transporter permease [Stellaceae bacterium]
MTAIAERLAPSDAPRQREWAAATMVALSILSCLVIAALLGVALWLSFAEGTPGDYRLGYSLAHYREIFLSAFTYRVVANTFIFSAIALVVALAFGLPIAWLVERTDCPGKRLIFTLLATALLIPGFAVALGWLFLLNPRTGILNVVLEALFGTRAAPFNISSLLGMGMVEGLNLAPLAFVMTAIVFRAMDGSLDEAARIGGAGTWQALRRITVPLAWPGVLAASIYIFTIGFGSFDVPAILGMQGRIFTFSTYVFLQISPSDGLPQYGGVATLSVFMMALAIAFSAWYNRAQRQAPRYAVITGKAYRPALIRLGAWRWPAIAFVALYLAVSQLLPILTLIWSAGLPFLHAVDAEGFTKLSLNNFRNLPAGLVWSGLGTSAALMLLVPTITLTLSVALSWVVMRSRLRFRAVFDFFAFLPHAVPKVVFSVAAWLLALFVLRNVVPIYGTIWILVPIYVVASLSYGTRMMNSALIQIHRELEESATIAGARLGGTLKAVLLPLLRPALLYSWIWIALLTYRELTIPVVLSTNDNQPLSVIVWSLVQSDSLGQGSAVAILMLLLMLPILALYAAVARRAGIVAR